MKGMEIDWRLASAILGLIGTSIATYYRTVYAVKDKFNDKIDDQNKQITDLKLEIERLKSKDELQQQVIDSLKKHVLDNLPAFYDAINQKDKKK